MTSTFNRTNSAAISAARELRPSAQRYYRDGATLDPAEITQPLHESINPLRHG
jgi:hypothetical protein